MDTFGLGKREEFPIFKFVGFMALLMTIPMIYAIFIHPFIKVWHHRMDGKAELAKAEFNRQIAICEAHAKKESSKALAEAEVIRAEGVAKANLIIGDSLEGNESYLKYLWIQGMQTNEMQVVYVPTEANLPILEAGRLSNK